VGSGTFEVVLFEDGDILYQILDVNYGNATYDNGVSATVGIRGANATNSLQYSYNTASLQDNFAVCFDNPDSPGGAAAAATLCRGSPNRPSAARWPAAGRRRKTFDWCGMPLWPR